MSRSKSRASSRHSAAAPAAASTVATRRWKSIPWPAVAVSVLVLITGAFATDAVIDSVTLGPVGEAHLTVPAAYLAIGPISNVLDTLTLLTVAQHIAVLLWTIGIFALVRVWRARSRGGTTVRREVIAAALLLAVIFATYAAGTMMPRPMAALATSDGTVLVADFHAHTKYSHDGRAGWSDDDARNWYRGAGFNVAYITDHATFEGAERGIASNTGLAGQGTMILQGLEAFYKGEHVNILSAGRRYRGLTNATLKDVDPEALALSSLMPSTTPVLIETIPGDLNKVPAASDTSAGVRAIEIVDGSPRGLSQGRRERQRIVHIADSLNLALVTGSDNHGWGRAAPAWTLVRVDGWRGMTTDSLSRRIEEILRNGRRESTKPIERRVAGATNPLTVLFAPLFIVWRMCTTLSADERVLWIIWTWGLVIVVRGVKRFRVRPSATTATA